MSDATELKVGQSASTIFAIIVNTTVSQHSVKRASGDSDPYSDFGADEFRCRLTIVVRSANLRAVAVFFCGLGGGAATGDF